MVQNVAGIVAEFDPADVYLLSGVEQGMRFAEWVDRGRLPEFSDLSPEEIDYRLDRCLDWGLIERKTIQYEGYKLTFEGYDALALHSFAKRGTIEGLGAPLGVGKESDVYEAQSYRPLALKYHREGITAFREVTRERSYTADREHVSWLYTARQAAEREYEVLEALYPAVSVPQPIDQNRHAIVMEKLPGVELADTKLEADQVQPVMDAILAELATAYDTGRVHADMSEYNVFVDQSGVTIFDWPQSVPTDHENAHEFLTRDVENVCGYFTRKHPGVIPDVDVSAIVAAITDGDYSTVGPYLSTT